jgi:3-hydroxyisobutyrate dehydrogenase
MQIAPGQTRIGWIGLGVMGAPMCGHLLDAGFSASVFTRTRAKAEPLVAKGARWVDTPRAVAEASDVVFTMVGFPQDVRAVILGEQGVLAGCKPGAVIVDMTSSEPALAEEIAEAARARGAHGVDAPVSGGDVGAREARLSIMIGGEPDVVEALQPCFSALGRTIVRHGGAGAGQHAKVVNQTLVAGCMVGVCEALLYAHRAGLDLEAVLESVASGAAGSWSLSNLAPRAIAGNFEPGFYVDHFVKDMGIALTEAQRMGIALPGLALARQLYVALQAQGHGQAGTQALVLALAALSDVEWPHGPESAAASRSRGA